MAAAATVMAIGNFDGVHVGHQTLLRTAREIAEPLGARVLAVTFEVHPLSVLRPNEAPGMLMHRDQRLAALQDAGADEVRWLRADAETLGMLPQQFIEGIVQEHQPRAIVEGPNFRFGRNRAGGPETLEGMGLELGFEARIIDRVLVTLRDKTQAAVSSTLVRWMVDHGRITDARLCLGRPFTMRGKVVVGERRGRTIGVPTVNLDTGGQLLPADGVYAGHADVDGVRHAAAISVGVKPTFADRGRLVEAHLLDYDGDLYDQTLDLAFERWLRDQQAFPSLEVLTGQLRSDIEQVRKLAAADLLSAVSTIRTA